MVAVEGVEGAEHGPSGAEGFGRVGAEAADVRADHGDLIQRGKLEHARDRDPVFVPEGEVVAEPVAHFGAGAHEGGTGDDHGTQGGLTSEHGSARGGRHHTAVQVVSVVFYKSVMMHEVRVESLV